MLSLADRPILTLVVRLDDEPHRVDRTSSSHPPTPARTSPTRRAHPPPPKPIDRPLSTVNGPRLSNLPPPAMPAASQARSSLLRPTAASTNRTRSKPGQPPVQSSPARPRPQKERPVPGIGSPGARYTIKEKKPYEPAKPVHKGPLEFKNAVIARITAHNIRHGLGPSNELVVEDVTVKWAPPPPTNSTTHEFVEFPPPAGPSRKGLPRSREVSQCPLTCARPSGPA